jgi:hypothetical protein
MNLPWRQPDRSQGRGFESGKAMADRAGLKIVGFIFATVTLAVMLTSVQVVKSQADSRDGTETTASISR